MEIAKGRPFPPQYKATHHYTCGSAAMMDGEKASLRESSCFSGLTLVSIWCTVMGAYGTETCRDWERFPGHTLPH